MKINLGNFLTKRALLSPTLEATVEPSAGWRRLNFRELNARCNQVSNALSGAGVAPGDRVGLLMNNSTEFLESFYAVAKIGAVNVPLNWRLVADELEFILKDSGTTVLLYSSEFEPLAAELQRRGAKTDIRLWVQVGGSAPAFAENYDAWMGSAVATEPELTKFDDDLLFIMYTSGTTGLPKGVMHTHNTVLWCMLTLSATADVRYGDRYLLALPLFHVGALTPVMGNIYIGATTVVLKNFDPKLVWELIRDEKVTSTLMVPAMLQFMQATYDKATHDCSTLRWCMSGAAPVPVTLIEIYAAMGIEVPQVYGLTESCGPGCMILGEDAVKRAGSTGRAYFHTDVRVVNPSDGRECAPGESGEVLIRGRHNMVGYWKRPDATAQTLRDGWLHTGDIGTMDEEGFVTIKDRIKDMLISGGENVYPAEIENLLLSHPNVVDAAVIGLASPKWGEVPLAVVVKKDTSLSEAELLEWCKGKLAPYKRPKVVAFTEAIPRNPTGKILKRVLRDEYSVRFSAPE